MAARQYLDVIADVSFQPGASPVSSWNAGGSLTTVDFGVRSGYSGQRFAAKVSLAPCFASYSKTQPAGTEPNSRPKRTFHFSAVAALSGDVRLTKHLVFRVTLEQMLIRYKSAVQDPAGIGKHPRLSFLSHDNYINSTNWELV